MKQSCARCDKLRNEADLVNYGGYLWDRVCLVKQIYQHVVSQEKRDALLAPYEITADELVEATTVRIVQLAAYA
jgi:hypothetical protein